MADGRLVSVVVAVHNGERFLGQAIESVLAQDHQPVEVVVVDDGSTDGTAAVARSFPEVRYLWQPNQGPGGARNAGMAVARGAFLAFCDHDDLYFPHKLSRQLRHLDEHPSVGCVLARHEIFLEPGTPEPRWLTADPIFGDPGGVEPTSALVPREVADRVDGFEPFHRYTEGLDWVARLRRAGVVIDVLPERLVRRRIHGSNASYDRSHLQRGMLKTVRRLVEGARDERSR